MLSGDVQLQQIPTVWNVSDLCTKALTQQQVKLLLHELNVCDDVGVTVIGQEEHDQQSERHGSKRQMMKLAKNLMRIFLFLWALGLLVRMVKAFFWIWRMLELAVWHPVCHNALEMEQETVFHGWFSSAWFCW